MSLPIGGKNNGKKGGKGARNNSQGSKFIIKPGGTKPAAGATKKATRTGGTRGS